MTRNVTECQQKLISLGYLPAIDASTGERNDDGVFGHKSLDAFNHYRAALGKPPIISTVTMTQLNADLFPEEQPPPPPKPITIGSLLPILIPLLTKGVPMTIPDIAGWLNSSVILGFLRNILISAGGVMTTTGLFTGAQWEQIVGVIIMIVSAILSALANKKAADAKEIAKAVEIHPALTIVPKTDGTAAIAVN